MTLRLSCTVKQSVGSLFVAADHALDTSVRCDNDCCCLRIFRVVQRRECGGISIGRFQRFLYFRVHGRIDAVATAVNHIGSISTGIVVFFLKVGNDILDNLVSMPVGQSGHTIRSGFHFFSFSKLYIIIYPFFIFALCQHSEITHFAQNIFTAFCVFLHTGTPSIRFIGGFTQWIIFGRSVCNRNQCCRLGYIEFTDILIKVELGRTLDTVTLIGKERNVQIGFHNLFLAVTLLQLQCSKDFLNLSFRSNLIITGQVLDYLLGNGGTTLNSTGATKIAQGRLDRSKPVNTMMFQKTLILRSNRYVDNHLRNFIIADPFTVLTGIQFFNNGFFLRFQVSDVDIGCIVEVYFDIGKIDNRRSLQRVEHIKCHYRYNDRTGNNSNKDQNGKSAAQSSKKPSDRSRTFCCFQTNPPPSMIRSPLPVFAEMDFHSFAIRHL